MVHGKRIYIVTDLGLIDVTNDAHILRNLNWRSTRILVM